MRLAFLATLAILLALELGALIRTLLRPADPIMAAGDPASAAIFVTNGACNSVTTYPAGASGDAAPISPRAGAALCPPAAVAVDHAGNIYVASANNTVTVYPAGSNGNAAPSATIGGAGTGMDRPEGIALDGDGNIYVTNGGNNTVTVYPAGSNGSVAPSATIGGPNTGLSGPAGIVLGGPGNIYVTNPGANAGFGTVTVYPAGSNGNVAPSATIVGASTGLDRPQGIALDGAGNIYVTNDNFSGGTDTVTVYPPGSNGSVAPSATIGGSSTGLGRPEGIALDGPGNIYVTNRDNNTVTVYPAGSNGNVAPSATIGGTSTGLSGCAGIALDGAGNIYVTNSVYPGTVTVYPAGSNGNVAPSATIGGASTGLGFPAAIASGGATPTPPPPIVHPSFPTAIALDGAGNIYVTNDNFAEGTDTVTVYRAGSNGNVAPSATICGINTGLSLPKGIALDGAGNIYVANSSTVTVYPAGSHGNVAPSAVIGGAKTGLRSAAGIALDAAGDIYVTNAPSFPSFPNGTVTIYPAGSKGNAAPSATIGGPLTLLGYPTGIAVARSALPPTATPTSSTTPIPAPVRATLIVGPNPLSFGSHKLCTSTSKSVSVQAPMSNHHVSVVVESFVVSGGADYSLDAAKTTCTPGQVLSPKDHCAIAIDFTPSEQTKGLSDIGRLQVSSNAETIEPNGGVVTLEGGGQAPRRRQPP